MRLLTLATPRATAAIMRDIHTGHGVTIREEARLDRLLGDEGQVTGARLASGEELPADAVIVGIGLDPTCHIAVDAGLECDGGVIVDAYGRTSAPGIWAAGDCALFPYRDGLTRLESVQNAIDMAQVVARNMLGAEEPYAPQPWFWSDQYDVKLQIAGLNTGYDRVVTRGGDAPPVSLWYFCGDALRAVDAVGDARAYMVGKRLIEAGADVTPDEVADPESDLKALLKR